MQESLPHPYSLFSSSPQTTPSPTNTPQPNVDMADSFFGNRAEAVKVNKLKRNLHAYVSVKLTERPLQSSQNIVILTFNQSPTTHNTCNTLPSIG